MPYYVYRVASPLRTLEKLAEFGAFREASSHAKSLRQQHPEGDPAAVRAVFADNELQAEDLLSQVREAPPQLGDD